jgi:hypothetical protein
VTAVPHRCPNCGVDLPDAERSVTFYCGNCRRLYLDAGGDYRRLQVLIPENVNPEHRLFPFWVYQLNEAEFDGKDQLLATLRLLRLNAADFYLPAFEITNPTRMLRLLSFYNSRRQEFAFHPQPSQNYSFADVVRTPEQAAELIVPLLKAAAAKDGYRLSEIRKSSVTDIGAVKLVWLPYVANRYFWCDQLTGATIERAAVNSG